MHKSIINLKKNQNLKKYKVSEYIIFNNKWINFGLLNKITIFLICFETVRLKYV